MSNRSVFAKILRLSCWIGDAILMALAVYLAIHYRDALTVNLALALGLCVVLGGLLPLGVYFVDYLFAQNERLMDEARSPEKLREAMKRLEQLTRRVEEAAEGATKSTLVARQIPDRIDEKLRALEAAATRLESRISDQRHEPPQSEPGPTVEDEPQEEPPPSSAEANEPVPFESEAVLAPVTEHLKSEDADPLPEIIPGVGPTGMEPTSPEQEEEEDSQSIADDWVDEPSTFEGGFLPEDDEKLSDAEDGLAAPAVPLEEIEQDPLSDEIAVESRDGAAPAVSPPEEPAKTPSSEPPEKTAEANSESGEAETPPAKNTAKNANSKSAPKKKRARKTATKRAVPKKKASPAAEEMSLFEVEELARPPDALAEDRVLLVVKAMVGIANKIYARGDAPLSRDQGIALEPSGIGEWRLDLTDITEPVQCELRLNDEVSASSGPLTLEPGVRTTVSPEFPEA